MELARVHEGALLGGHSLLFADQAVAFAQVRWFGMQLSELSAPRQSLAGSIRATADGAYSADISLADRLKTLSELGQQIQATFVYQLHASNSADACVAAAHALGLEFGLSPTEALQVAAAVAWHVHMGRCADTAFRCLPRRLIALKESGRSVARLLRWRPGQHALEAAQLVLLAAEASGLGTLEAKMAAAAGALSIFGVSEREVLFHASTVAAEDFLADTARLAWMLSMSTKASRVVDVLQSTPETGEALAMRLGSTLVSEVSALEGGLGTKSGFDFSSSIDFIDKMA